MVTVINLMPWIISITMWRLMTMALTGVLRQTSPATGLLATVIISCYPFSVICVGFATSKGGIPSMRWRLTLFCSVASAGQTLMPYGGGNLTQWQPLFAA